jgi:hypothetical protein
MPGGHPAARTVTDARVGENARVPAYAVNEDAVGNAKRLIHARRYVLRSRWQDVQPRAREQNAFLKAHSWEEYARGVHEYDPAANRAQSSRRPSLCTGRDLRVATFRDPAGNVIGVWQQDSDAG